MTIRTQSELKFCYSAGALATVEINLDSLDRAGVRLEKILAPTLARLAAASPAASATLYTQSLVSFNFGQPCWSLFLAVCGADSVLRGLHSAFSQVAGVESRYSDEIAVKRIQARYHLQDGALWLPADEFGWQRFELPEVQAADKRAVAEKEEEEDEFEELEEFEDDDSEDEFEELEEFEDDDEDELGELEEFEDDDEEEFEEFEELEDDEDEDDESEDEDEDEDEQPVRPARRAAAVGRRRIARSDASVGTIRETIEQLFGLPAGSVALRGPDRRPLRADATIQTLRNRWEQ